MALWLATLQLVLDKGQEEDWFSSTWITRLTIISIIAMIAFIIRELRVKEPIVDLRVLLNRNFCVGVILISVMGAVLYSTLSQLPLLLQTLMGYTSMQSGMAVSPRGFGSMVSTILIGRIVGIIDSAPPAPDM